MSVDPGSPSGSNSPIVIAGIACRVPGADDVNAFAELLFHGRTGYSELPADRCDRALYFDPLKGKTGKTYTTLGGTVPERPLDRELCPLTPGTQQLFDVAHVQFAEVAATAWRNAELSPGDRRLSRTGIFVGHSGGTKSGGALSLGTQIEEALSFADDIEAFRQLPAEVRSAIISEVAQVIRRDRPSRRLNAVPSFHAYQAAALSAQILGLTGPRSVIDAACASSLVALAQAMMAIRAGRIDSAIVGGATYNNVDNLILFSHSQACTATDSRPFDDGASGLVSSEGYVAIVITTRELAIRHDLPMLGVIRGVGMASDGRGRSLWAPRMEGQVLAIQRAYADGSTLDIDYMEAHATSTQLGDATELETLRQLASGSADFQRNRTSGDRLLLGSVKSNIGHTLEAAGLIGLVKVLLAMQRRQIPASLRYEQPNHNYDWSTAPVRVVAKAEAWPDRLLHIRPRRAAVSAFGIGGLNAHAVVEESFSGFPCPPNSGEKVSVRPNREALPGNEPQSIASFSAAGPPHSREPIAIIGRGLVVAGAKNLTEFKAMLESDRSAVCDAPSDRWRKRTGIIEGELPQTYRAPHCRGGFITDFTFDGARFRIPPKQVQQANPVQMMLLDAVAQALADVSNASGNAEAASGGSEQRGKVGTGEPAWPMDRQRIGVVIGTIFGGEFGDQLQVGMRLPEICERISAAMQRRGLPQPLTQKVADEFRQIVLKNRPALLDETGSFTASTLASRVAKTFDLMGGACALDSDDASGLAALAVSVDQLQSGICDMVVCGSAQRSMSLSAFEALDMSGRLVRSGRTEDIPDDCRQIIPGEGVVALILCRLSDARRLNLPVHGILENVGQSVDDTQLQSRSVEFTPGIATENGAARLMTAADAAIVRKVGYLPGAHSLIRITAETLGRAIAAGSHPQDTRTTEFNGLRSAHDVMIEAATVDGIVMQAALKSSLPPQRIVPMASVPSQIPPVPRNVMANSTPKVSPSMTNRTATSDRPLHSVRFAATTAEALLRLLKDATVRLDQLLADRRVVRDQDRNDVARYEFVSDDCFRAVILASTAEQLKDRLAAAIKTAEAGKFRVLLDRERVILWQTKDQTARVAWLFPGQGSHYPDTPAAMTASEVARRTLSTVDDLYAASNLPCLSKAFGNAAIKPGEDVWWAQAWVLGVSASLIETLKSEGLRPDAVLGHSFGEFTASLASGVTTLSETIELARHRANAVMSHMRTAGGLLSVRAAVHEVDSILKSAALPVFVTHLNSPKQTVIAGSRDGILAAKSLLDRQGLAAMSISVPAPFHTPLLAEAEVAFERMSASVPMRPPVCGFLSATSVQYLAEPSGIRHSLVRQLTQPVMYMPSIQRMLGEGFRVFLEVGPNDVLTRMNRDIVDSRAICLSLDVPGQAFDERMMLIHAVLECVANIPASHRRSATLSSRPAIGATGELVNNLASRRGPAEVTASVFDVTRSRRTGKKADAAETLAPAPTMVASFASPEIVPTQRPAAVASTDSGISEAQLRTFTRDLVIELTGYSPDIVDFDADLEADLGIDSIKKAQILGELGEWLGLTMRPDSLRLDSVRTLDDAVRMALKLAGDEAALAPQKNTVTPETRDIAPAASAQMNGHASREVVHRMTEHPEAADSGMLLPSNDRLDALLIDYVVDQTGYSRDVVDVDADLEADLGLDSIKLAQLIGEMREQFNLESLTLESIAQARFRTLRGIRDFLISHAGGQQQSPSRDTATGSFQHRQNAVSAATSTGHRAVTEFESAERLSNRGPSAPANGHSSIRGLEPIEEITPEWFSPTFSEGHSSEAVAQAGVMIGQKHRSEIRSTLRSLVQQAAPLHAKRGWSSAESAHFKGLAEGAGVAEASIRLAATVARTRLNPDAKPDHSEAESEPVNSDGMVDSDRTADVALPDPKQTHRYALRVVPAPRRAGMPLNPELHGAALILGANALAEILAERIRQLGQQAIVLNPATPIAQIEQTLTDLWKHTGTPHLFLTMAFDPDSTKSLAEEDWKRRRSAALEAPFRICQLWMQRTIDANLMENASVVSVTQLGGDFGFSGQQVKSIEAIGGLVKAMLIEAWMRGFRTTPMKVLDAASGMTPQEITSGVLQELAVPSYDMEIAFRSAGRANEPQRLCVQAISAPLTSSPLTSAERQSPIGDRGTGSMALAAGPTGKITRGGTWIISGGGRGITAVIAMTLAKKYDLKLHLLGTAPVPQLSDDFVRAVAQDRSGVRRGIMQDASARGVNPVEAWRNTEKAIEIDATLRDCVKQRITAIYHCCDVSDFADVERTIHSIRRSDGVIHGVIHGAGAGQDARFDRKRPDKVEKCLQAKIDGSLALMQATNTDPLGWFVTFGSISGRFGANGHTDYSLANDMMAKIVDRYRSQRPEVRSLTFHWHAWGDIGMATKPEAKLALEMIDMEFMPARDGIAHFMRELEFGGDEPEVLITDESYFRKFFPAERLSLTASTSEAMSLPLIPATVTQHADCVCSSVVTLNPVTDKFLSQHRVQGRPTLPFVVALELMAEAVRVRTSQSSAGVCTQARALQAIRFSTDDPLAVTVQTRPADNGAIECRLLADVRRRDGRMVEEDREFFRAVFDPRLSASQQHASTATVDRPRNLAWKRIEYVSPEGLIYHGPELQELREIADDGQNVFGRIAASAPVQLFGGSRARGFTVPCTTMDACLYAVGYATWHRHQKPSLPVRFEQIEFGRLPDPGEPCLVRITQTHISESGATWDFVLQGHNGDRLLTVNGYRIGWLKAGS